MATISVRGESVDIRIRRWPMVVAVTFRKKSGEVKTLESNPLLPGEGAKHYVCQALDMLHAKGALSARRRLAVENLIAAELVNDGHPWDDYHPRTGASA